MPEIREITELHHRSGAAGSSVLLTLINVIGSSYRRPGAHLLTTHSGEYAGLVSGGCLEAEVLRKAEWLVRRGAVVTRYSTLFDDSAEMPFGLGCGGEVDLLLEPAATPECVAWFAAAASSLHGDAMTVATLLPSSTAPLQRIVWDSGNRCLFASNEMSDDLCSMLAHQLALKFLADTAPLCTELQLADGPTRRIFVERIQPPQRLFIFGAGRDALPLAEFSAQLGWRTTVADGRSQYVRADNFPHADSVVLLPQDGDPLAALDVTPQDAAVLMTHSYEQDRRLLQSLLQCGPRYLGLLGARQRSRLLIEESAAALGLSFDECRARLHAPVGLDLGSDAPESIALAIIAEIQAHLHSRSAGNRNALFSAEAAATPFRAIECRPHFKES